MFTQKKAVVNQHARLVHSREWHRMLKLIPEESPGAKALPLCLSAAGVLETKSYPPKDKPCVFKKETREDLVQDASPPFHPLMVASSRPGAMPKLITTRKTRAITTTRDFSRLLNSSTSSWQADQTEDIERGAEGSSDACTRMPLAEREESLDEREEDKAGTPLSSSDFGKELKDTCDPYDWQMHARPEQCEPAGEWRVWLILAGRGFGKTRTGAETVRAWVESNRYKRIGLVGATEADIRHVMVEGSSGLLSTYPPEEAPRYEASKRQITWPNGAVAHLISAERFEKLRGRQFDAVWVDELAKFRYGQETWDQLTLAMRLGSAPKVVVTTTPRPTALIKRLVIENAWTKITRGSTYANHANLAPGFIDHVVSSCQNERLLRQEIEGEIVDDVVGALWRRDTIDHQRVDARQLPEMQRVVVAVDPSVAHHEEGDETGIVVAGLGVDQKGYVLADFSGRYGTPGWAEQVVQAYEKFEADCIVAEENQGGALVEQVLRTIDPNVFYQKVRAARGKLARAEPVASLYVRGRVHHVGQDLRQLESQLCTYVPGVSTQSPDRLDALVWAISSLMLGQARPKNSRLWSLEKMTLQEGTEEARAETMPSMPLTALAQKSGSHPPPSMRELSSQRRGMM